MSPVIDCCTHKSHTHTHTHTHTLQRTSKMVSSHRYIDEKREESEILDILLKHYQSKLKLTVSKIKGVSHCSPHLLWTSECPIERAKEFQVNLGILSKPRISLCVIGFHLCLKAPLKMSKHLDRLVAFWHQDTYKINIL